MEYLTKKGLYHLLENFNKKFISDSSNVQNFSKYYPIGRLRHPTEEFNYPLFVKYNKKSTKRNSTINIILYTANDFPTDVRETLLYMSIDEFSYENFDKAIKNLNLNDTHIWEENLDYFIQSAQKKYK